MKGEQTLQTLCAKSALYLRRHSSTILTCLGAVGVVATAVASAKATPKAIQLLEKVKEEKGEELTKTEAIINAAPAYFPSVAIGAATIACVFGANILNQRQQAALTSAYALVDTAYKDYRNKVKEMLGEETDVKIRDAIAIDKRKDIDVYAPGCGSIDTSGETCLFYDEYRRSYFESTMAAVLNAEYHFNRNFSMRGYASLNEFYEFLGLPPVEEGDVLGWTSWVLAEDYEAAWIDFDHRKITLEDGMECYKIELPIPPYYDYEGC